MSITSFVRFVLVGLTNTVVGYGIILLLHYGFRIEPIMANLGGYLIGAFLSYTLNRRFTFNSGRPHAEALPRFALAAAGSYLLNLVVLKLCLSVFMLPVALAQALAVSAYTIVFYLISRFLIFRP